MLKYEKVDKDFSLEGKTAVITGGSSGIGYATAEFFKAKGVNLVLAARNPKIDEIAKALGGNCIGVSGDICEPGQPERIIKAGAEAFGRIDILVSCAGVTALGNAESISLEDWSRVISINLTGNFLMAQAAGRYMIGNKINGCIVNMASQAGVVALDGHVAYCASKGGIIAMTKVLAKEWGAYGIRVNCVSPTVVLTAMGHKAWDGPAGDAFKKEMPSGRFAEPDEIAAAVAFLCSAGASMITGHNLLVDGGFTIK